MTTLTPNSTCATCRARIVYAWTNLGMRLPVDPYPVPGGNLDVAADGQHGSLLARYVDADPDVVRYVSHFATCPDADRHRRPRGAARFAAAAEPEAEADDVPLPFPPSTA
jgi:hypothetical protein